MSQVVAFGNPLLDTIVFLEDETLLKKYNLKSDGQKEVSREEMRSLVNDIKGYEKTIAAGGCAQNTLKVMQWLLQNQCSTTIFGAVGDDKEGEILKNILETQGIKTNYIVQSGYTTGMTISLVNKNNRSLVACLGAADVLSLHNVTNNFELPIQIKKANLIYIEGFFLTKRVEVAQFISKLCKKHNKKIVFNTSGEYLCKEQPDIVKYFLEQSDIIFGNKREFEAIYAVMNQQNVDNLLTELGNRGKIVVMTDGAESVVYVSPHDSGRIDVPLLAESEIVDTTGAGDSFVAGFLVGYILKKPLKVCSEIGCYAAQEIIKKRGCIVPDYKPKIIL